jgi:hypothetical protein
VVVGVDLVFRHFLRVDLSEGLLAHLLAHARVELAHLAALPDAVAGPVERVGGLDAAAPGRRPDRQRLQRRRLGGPGVDALLPLRLAVGEDGLRHPLGVAAALVAEPRVGPVAVLVGGHAGAAEVRLPALDVQVEEVEDDPLGEVAEGAVVDHDPLAGVDHLDVVELALLHRLELGDPRVDAVEVVLDRGLGGPADVVRRADLDGPDVLLDDLLVRAGALDEQGLDVLLLELLRQGTAARRQGVHRVIDGDLSVLVVQKVKDVLAALLEDLVPKHYRRRLGVDMEIVLRDLFAGTDDAASIVAEVKDVGLDAQPTQVSCQRDTDVSLAPSW